MCPSESISDLLTSVKLLAAPTVDIAAASVGEKSLVDVVRQMEEEADEGKDPDSAVTVDGLESQVEAPVADDAAVAESAEETKVSEEDAEEAMAPAAEEETPAEDEETAMSPPAEEPVGETGPDLVEAQSPEEPADIEEVAPAAEEEEEAEEPVAEAAQMVQLEEASAKTEGEVPSAAETEPKTAEGQDESCHCAPPADDLAPPSAVEGVLACEETMDSMIESEEPEAPSE